MSRVLLTQLEQVDYLIGPVYVNPNYSDEVNDLLNNNNIILSPPEINVMTTKKTYPPTVIESGKQNRYATNESDNLTNISNRQSNINQNDVKRSLLDLLNSEEQVKENFINEYTKNNINYKNLRHYFIK